ncbi:hypothetical protein [Myceligenerans xiligouense]|nr:hypothetical protein [Myceligenerans xiligouense]
MYNANTPAVLAATGAAVTTYYLVGVWALLLAGAALVWTTRVLKARAARR